MGDDWDSREFIVPEPGWVAVDETGWDALKLWYAGPDNRARAPRDDGDRVVRVSRESADRQSLSITPFNADDLQIFESGVDAYLEDAGILPLPHGYRWYLRLPDGWSVDFVDQIDGMLNPRLSGAPRPADVLGHLKPIMDALYLR
ncbi:DUF5956 family protein [Diaminobutyricibacter sp. McL0608]|uniref:DUF5956 family protein n=1 Tax=Leifsonia sp. McL0608 TaxID=3143537 RepID=UPI0031F2DA0E